MEPTLIEEMRQLKRLEELDLINPACEWSMYSTEYLRQMIAGGYDEFWKDWARRALRAREIHEEILAECTIFENKYC